MWKFHPEFTQTVFASVKVYCFETLKVERQGVFTRRSYPVRPFGFPEMAKPRRSVRVAIPGLAAMLALPEYHLRECLYILVILLVFMKQESSYIGIVPMRGDKAMKLNEIKSKIEKRIVQVNGKRSERLIGMADVIQALREATETESYGATTGGYVAKSYKFAAVTSAVYALEFAPGHVVLALDTINAHGASETKWATSCSSNDIQGQKLAFGPRTDIWPNFNIFMTRRQALALTAESRKASAESRKASAARDKQAKREAAAKAKREAAAMIAEIPSVALTAEISLAAGNCKSQTARVAKLVNRSHMNARDLASFLVRKGLRNLVPYVARAANYAVNHAR